MSVVDMCGKVAIVWGVVHATGSIVADRQKNSDNEHTLLVTEVNGVCPKCGTSLMYSAGQRLMRGYDVAHIYPLSPSPAEEALLANEERLSGDVNDLKNLIPLCRNCHKTFDHPRTLGGYREMVAIKREAMRATEDRKAWRDYGIHDEIARMINVISDLSDEELNEHEFGYLPKPIEEKMDQTVPSAVRRRLKGDVGLYYKFVQKELRQIESAHPGKSEDFLLQAKRYFVRVKGSGRTHEGIIEAMSEWLTNVAKCNISTAQIVVSYLIQNCEVL